MREKVRLYVTGIHNDTFCNQCYVVELQPEGYGCSLLVSIPADEGEAVRRGYTGERTPRPQTHDLFTDLFGVLNIKVTRVLIHHWYKGDPYFYLYVKSPDTLLRSEARPSDALAMALRARAPIFIYKDVLEEALSGSANSMEIRPLNPEDTGHAVSNGYLNSLQRRLNDAIEREDYEMAARLRDELAQARQNKN